MASRLDVMINTIHKRAHPELNQESTDLRSVALTIWRVGQTKNAAAVPGVTVVRNRTYMGNPQLLYGQSPYPLVLVTVDGTAKHS